MQMRLGIRFNVSLNLYRPSGRPIALSCHWNIVAGRGEREGANRVALFPSKTERERERERRERGKRYRRGKFLR